MVLPHPCCRSTHALDTLSPEGFTVGGESAG